MILKFELEGAYRGLESQDATDDLSLSFKALVGLTGEKEIVLASLTPLLGKLRTAAENYLKETPTGDLRGEAGAILQHFQEFLEKNPDALIALGSSDTVVNGAAESDAVPGHIPPDLATFAVQPHNNGNLAGITLKETISDSY